MQHKYITTSLAVSALILATFALNAQENYITQTGNFNSSKTINTPSGYFAGHYNNGASELATYANGGGPGYTGDPGVASFRTYTSSGSNNTAASRPLQLGDEFSITAYVGNSSAFFNNSKAGISFNGNTSNSAFTDYNSGQRLKLQINQNGNWFVAGTTTANGFSTPGQDVTVKFKVIAPNRVNVTLIGSNAAVTKDLLLSGTTNETIKSFVIWNQSSGANNDMYWKNASLTATGSLEIGGSNSSYTISNALTDGLDANSSTLVKTNSLLKEGTGTITLTGANTYTGATTISQGTLILQGNVINSDITVASTGTLIIDGTDIKIKSLTVNSGGTVVINAGKALTISNNLTNNSGGSMTLNSTSTTYSSLIVNGTVSGTGTNNYKRFVNGNASVGGNDLISSPMGGQQFGAFASNNSNLVQDPNDNSRKLFGPFNKPTGTFLIYDLLNNANTPIDSGVGYRAAATSSNNGTLTFSGIVNTGTVTRSIENTTGVSFAPWNLIGNPYPSYLYIREETGSNAHAGFLTTNASELSTNFVGIYGYDNNTSDGSNYTIYNFANTTSSTTMAPGQGFFVVSKANGGSISFTPGMRAIGTGDDFINGRQQDENNALLKLKITNGTQNYVTDFYFNDASTLGLDPGYDAGVFGGNPPAFSVYSQLVEGDANLPLAIQSLPYTSLESEIIIPIGIKATQGQQITVSILETTVPTGIEVYLEDTVAAISTLLNTNNYSFTTETNLTGFGRFNLRFTNTTLSNLNNELSDIQILSIPFPKKLIVKGELKSEAMLNLYDLQGRLYLSSHLNSSVSENQVDVSSVSTGVYLVTLNTTRGKTTKKVIIK